MKYLLLISLLFFSCKPMQRTPRYETESKGKQALREMMKLQMLPEDNYFAKGNNPAVEGEESTGRSFNGK